MKAATVSEIKRELSQRSPKELMEFCLTLAKFKKENKELLTYLLYERTNETAYIESVQREVDLQFENINTTRFYLIKKSVRKILRMVKKYIRYSKRKDTEVELLLYFCKKLKTMRPSITRNKVLQNILDRQLQMIQNILPKLEEDLQYDYGLELDELRNL